MSSPLIPSAQQLEAARLQLWHQQPSSSSEESEAGGDATTESSAAHRLLTLEACRNFVQRNGVLLFTPRPQLAEAPAPTLVEATLGRRESAPSLSDQADARRLVAAMIAEGSAVALNLLGAPGTTAETPDFVASTAAFAFVFTLRGDKLWKRPPETAGSLKVSPLAANIFGLLLQRDSQSAGELAQELGKGVTEAAVLRALSELWQHLRVLPVLQAEGAATLWETSAARFTKQMKAGANAGQPTALSAVVSLYLGQVLLATEDEISTFVSPLASRSRVHDVLQALGAAQQLEGVVLEGKRHLKLAHEEHSFPALTAQPDRMPEESVEQAEARPGRERIRSFAPSRPSARVQAGRTYTPRGDARPQRAGARSGTAGKPWERKRSEFKRPADQRSGRRERDASGTSPQDPERPSRTDDDRWRETRRTAQRPGESGGRGGQRFAGTQGFRRDGGWGAPRRREQGDAPGFGRQESGKPPRREGRPGERERRPFGQGQQRSGERGRPDQRTGPDGGPGKERRPFRRFDAPRDDRRPQRTNEEKPERRPRTEGKREGADSWRSQGRDRRQGAFDRGPNTRRPEQGGRPSQGSGAGGYRQESRSRDAGQEGRGFRRKDDRRGGEAGAPPRKGPGGPPRRFGAPPREARGSGRPRDGGARRPAGARPAGAPPRSFSQDREDEQ